MPTAPERPTASAKHEAEDARATHARLDASHASIVAELAPELNYGDRLQEGAQHRSDPDMAAPKADTA